MFYTTGIIIKTLMEFEQKPPNFIANQLAIDRKIMKSSRQILGL